MGQRAPVCPGHLWPICTITRVAVELAFAAPRARSAAVGVNSVRAAVDAADDACSVILVAALSVSAPEEVLTAGSSAMNVCVGVETVSDAELADVDAPSGILVAAVSASPAVDVAAEGNSPTTPAPAVTLRVAEDVAVDA
jgi:hypothetical protein